MRARRERDPSRSDDKYSPAPHPEVEVVVRRKTDGDRFVFVLNCGGAGAGCVVLPGRASRVLDALNREAPVPFRRSGTHSLIPVKLDAWGYRVLRVTAN